jgi:ferredoxin--NADP+ reductase
VLASTVTLLKLDTPEIAKKVKPGQFVIIRLNEEGERLPLTVNDFDREKGTITIVFQEVGKTTKLLGKLEVNEQIADVVGPLGKHTEIEKFGKVICIGGGVGTAAPWASTRKSRSLGRSSASVGAWALRLFILSREPSIRQETRLSVSLGRETKTF